MARLKRAGEIDIGDVVLIDGRETRIEGWFFPAGVNLITLEYSGRWHTHRASDQFDVVSAVND